MAERGGRAETGVGRARMVIPITTRVALPPYVLAAQGRGASRVGGSAKGEQDFVSFSSSSHLALVLLS